MGDDVPLCIPTIVRRGAEVYPDRVVVTSTGTGVLQASFATVTERAARLIRALQDLGVEPGDRVGTFAWNTQEHQEAYLAVPGMGAVLHTLNIRLLPEQVAWIANHGEDKVVIVDGSLLPVFAPAAEQMPDVRVFVVTGDADLSPLPRAVRYDDVVNAAEGGFSWPDIDERAPAAMCYTSGTTGDPKGVVYSHRSTWLHSLAVTSGAALGIGPGDRVLPVVPMFHANAWGLPYACWMVGADIVLPSRFLQAEHLSRLIRAEHVTVAGGVPTIWNDLLHYADQESADQKYADHHDVDLSSVRLLMCGGSAVPRAMIERFRDRFGATLIQGWGMTEMSPVGTLAFEPRDADDPMAWRATAGQPLPGVEVRVVTADGEVAPCDGTTQGELEARGPWVTTGYHAVDATDRFRDGWLRTGDLATIDERRYVRIGDRAKDVIKSGGEWISSLDLEAAILEHPDVANVAVVAAPDERWGERPLACVVQRPGAPVTATALREHLSGRVPKWWVPERWCFLDAIPLTGVGKFDKKVLRARLAHGELDVVDDASDPPSDLRTSGES